MSQSKKIQKIEKALEEVRPYLEKDGGDISIAEFSEDGILKVFLHGQCKHCHLKDMTLATGIEEALKKWAPFVKKVVEAESFDS